MTVSHALDLSHAGGLFQLLRDGLPRTRADLAKSTGLSRPTIAQRIDQLLGLGLITPVSDAASTGGRPSSQFAFNPQARVVVAADFGASHARLAVTDLTGTVLAELGEEREISDGPVSAIEWLKIFGPSLLTEADRSADDVVGVGIGLPGPVEFSTGRPINPPIMPGWDRFDLPGALKQTFSAPVLVDNDVNIMALGEQTSAWPETTDLIFVKVATGIGAGIISGGSLCFAARMAPRATSATSPCPGPRAFPAPAAIAGAWQAVASGRSIARELSRAGLEARTPGDVIRLVKAGDLQAIQAVRQAGRDLGEVLTTCVSLMNPSLILIGGAMAQAAEHLVAGVREVVYARSIPLSTEHLTIAPSNAAGNAAILGAAHLGDRRGTVTRTHRRRPCPGSEERPTRP